MEFLFQLGKNQIRLFDIENNYEPLYAITLDRGSAIVGMTMDLLYPSEADTVIIGRAHNIIFTVERWGW